LRARRDGELRRHLLRPGWLGVPADGRGRLLHGEVGDSAFFRGVREYYRTYRDSAVLSDDFERVAERVAGRDLGWFFR
jgi:hypothetical protein